MLIQTAERRHHREVGLAEPGAWWPHNALDLWWRGARRAPDRQLLALRMLDQWRDYATWQLGSALFGFELSRFLEATDASARARMLDRMSVSALVAISLHRRLRADYAGPAFDVRDSTAGTTSSVYVLGDTTDMPSMLTTLAGHAGTIATAYDQGTGARDLTATTNLQPQISSGSLRTFASGVPCARWDGSDDELSRADLLGLTGNPAIVVAMVAQVVAVTVETAFAIGRNASTRLWGLGVVDDTHVFAQNGSGVRRFTSTSLTGGVSRLIWSKASGDTCSAYTARQNGSDLSQSFLVNGSSTLNLDTGSTLWGRGANNEWLNFDSNFLAIFGSPITGNDRDQLELEMLLHS